MLSHHIIPDFITNEEREYFLSLIDSEDFINHRSTRTGLPSPLNFLPIQFRGLERAFLMKMNPNAEQPWHVDGVNLRRHSVIIHPITENYAPLVTLDGEVTETAIVNTQVEHAVFNNDCVRMNLQIPIDMPFEDLINDRTDENWKLIEGLYS